MANTYEIIASITAGSGGLASIDFTNIPATYTDLSLRYSLRGTNSNDFSIVQLKFNDSSAGYSDLSLFGNIAGPTSSAHSLSYLWVGYYQGDTTTSNTFGNGEIYIPGYKDSLLKTVSIDQASISNSTAGNSGFVTLNAGIWTNTTAITKISLTNEYGNWKQYSTAYLYGIKNS